MYSYIWVAFRKLFQTQTTGDLPKLLIDCDAYREFRKNHHKVLTVSQHLRRDMPKPTIPVPSREERKAAQGQLQVLSLTASQMFDLVSHDLDDIDRENKKQLEASAGPIASTTVCDIQVAGDNWHPLIASLSTVQDEIILCKLSNKAVDEFLMWSKDKEVEIIHFPKTPSPPQMQKLSAPTAPSYQQGSGGPELTQCTTPQEQVQATSTTSDPMQLPPIVIQPAASVSPSLAPSTHDKSDQQIAQPFPSQVQPQVAGQGSLRESMVSVQLRAPRI